MPDSPATVERNDLRYQSSYLASGRYAPSAIYRLNDGGLCVEGTRRSVLEEIEDWAKNTDPGSPQIYWLSGLAGTGKTTIARTIVERRLEDNEPVASFFCSPDPRNNKDWLYESSNKISMLRDDPHAIFPTLAIQLANECYEFDSKYERLILVNPDIIFDCLNNQMNQLIIRPLQKSDLDNPLIVIDGLDQCKRNEDIASFLSTLNDSISKIPYAKFLITSRTFSSLCPREALSKLARYTKIKYLHEVEVKDDMKLFFENKLSKLNPNAKSRGHWLAKSTLKQLSKDAGILFVYATEMAKLICRCGNDNIHLNLVQPSEERTRLCSFYSSILEEVFGGSNDKDAAIRDMLRPVLVAAGYISPKEMASRSKLGFRTLEYYLSYFQPLLIVPKDSNKPVEGLHHSFFSFLSDEGLCPRRFHVPLEWTEGDPLLAVKAVAI